MRRQRSRPAVGQILLVWAAYFFLTMGTSPLDQADVQKIYASVAGTYEFTYEGQSLTVVFLVKDGKLYGREESDSEEAEIKPLDLNALKFETTVQSTGQYYEIVFSRDESGKLNKCRLVTGGIGIDGVRVK